MSFQVLLAKLVYSFRGDIAKNFEELCQALFEFESQALTSEKIDQLGSSRRFQTEAKSISDLIHLITEPPSWTELDERPRLSSPTGSLGRNSKDRNRINSPLKLLPAKYLKLNLGPVAKNLLSIIFM